MDFNKDSLRIDPNIVIDGLCETIRDQVRRVLKKSGAVVGISGGIDSSVVAALCAKALGPERVIGVMMPEKDSASESKLLALKLAEEFGFETVTEEISEGLAGLACYRKRDEAIKRMFPDYDPRTHRSKITIASNVLEASTYNFFNMSVEDEAGKTQTRRMPMDVYLQVVAATNYKQRLRMTTLYYHAERKNFAVVGTGNKDEHMQGFFVKYGDGGADLKPIAHLYKMQIYQLAVELGIPDEIVKRVPTTDTYSSEVTQAEFFFGLDFYRMDMLWYAMEHDVAPEKAATVLGLSASQVECAYANIKRKIVATEYLRMPPLEAE